MFERHNKKVDRLAVAKLTKTIAQDLLEFYTTRVNEDKNKVVHMIGMPMLKQKLRAKKSDIIYRLALTLDPTLNPAFDIDERRDGDASLEKIENYKDIKLLLTTTLRRLKVENKSANSKGIIPVAMGTGKSEKLIQKWLDHVTDVVQKIKNKEKKELASEEKDEGGIALRKPK